MDNNKGFISLILGIILGAGALWFLNYQGYLSCRGTSYGTTKGVELRLALRKLWSDHVFWTRQFIVSTLADLDDAKDALDRLLKNQDDLGNAIVPYYGADAGKKLAALLRDHIVIAGDVVAAAQKDE